MIQKDERAEQYCSKSVESAKRSTSRTKAFLVASVLASLTEPVHHSSSTTTAATVSVAFVCVTEFAILLQHCLLALLRLRHDGLGFIKTGGVFLSRCLGNRIRCLRLCGLRRRVKVFLSRSASAALRRSVVVVLLLLLLSSILLLLGVTRVLHLSEIGSSCAANRLMRHFATAINITIRHDRNAAAGGTLARGATSTLTKGHDRGLLRSRTAASIGLDGSMSATVGSFRSRCAREAHSGERHGQERESP